LATKDANNLFLNDKYTTSGHHMCLTLVRPRRWKTFWCDNYKDVYSKK